VHSINQCFMQQKKPPNANANEGSNKCYFLLTRQVERRFGAACEFIYHALGLELGETRFAAVLRCR
jgi:hypothetical protein